MGLVTLLSDEAAALNERIRAGRIERREVDDTVTETGSDGLPIGAGDLIQTRRNDSDLCGRKNPRTVALPAEYVAEEAARRAESDPA